MNKFAWPLVGFAALVALLAAGLRLNPREVPSPLVGRPAPDFEVAQLHEPQQTFNPRSMMGKVWMLNVWASWCVSCRVEHPVLITYAKSRGAVPLIGLNHKDKRDDGIRWLMQHGNPYAISAFDLEGRVGIQYGVYGVPETYLIDKNGVIRFKQIGPVTEEVLAQKILPLIKELSS